MNQLTDFKTLDTKNIIFSETYVGKYSKFIPIAYSHSNDKEEEEDDIHQLILNTPPNLYTPGLKEQLDRTKTDVIGYNLRINMWNKRNGPSEEEKQFTDKLNEILEYIRAFLYSIQEELGIDESLIKDLRLLSDYGKDSKDYQPQLFCKLMMNNRSKKILTSFYNEETKSVLDPLEILSTPTEKKPGLVTSALKFENISISERRINIEIKVIEMLYTEIKQKTRQSMLKPHIVWKDELHKNGKNNYKKKESKHNKNDMILPTNPERKNQNPYQALAVED